MYIFHRETSETATFPIHAMNPCITVVSAISGLPYGLASIRSDTQSSAVAVHDQNDGVPPEHPIVALVKMSQTPQSSKPTQFNYNTYPFSLAPQTPIRQRRKNLFEHVKQRTPSRLIQIPQTTTPSAHSAKAARTIAPSQNQNQASLPDLPNFTTDFCRTCPCCVLRTA